MGVRQVDDYFSLREKASYLVVRIFILWCVFNCFQGTACTGSMRSLGKGLAKPDRISEAF